MRCLPILALAASAAFFTPGALADDALSADAEAAFVYGYPRVLMDVTERRMTHAPEGSWFGAPINHFKHLDTVAGPGERVVVRPNTDTLYSSAWLDLSKGPVILHVPESAGRYYVLEMLDAWTNVFGAPGTRTTGVAARDFAIVGPGFSGAIPPGMALITAPTSKVWVLGRTLIQGPDDLPDAQAFQRGITLSAPDVEAPPAQQAAAAEPPGTPPEEVAAMDGLTFLRLLAARMGDEAMPPLDEAMIGHLTRLGFAPGVPFAPTSEVAAVLDAAKRSAEARIAAATQHLGTNVNGWRMVLQGIGEYGTDYQTRAAVALFGLGANLPEDAVYPVTSVDGAGQPLSGAHAYVLHFAPGQLPPADAFWSLTLYDAAGYLVPNALDRHALNDRAPLTYGADGSLDLYVQSDSPGSALESNWLPAPAGAPFNLMLRLYLPRAPVLSGAWSPPPVQPR